jgi:Family of unknown function (DUF6311)
MLEVERGRALRLWRVLLNRAWLACPALLGATLGVYVVGLGRLNPYNLSWLSGDLVVAYAAWTGINQQSGPGYLQFTQLSYPLPIEVALFDSMPLFILATRPFLNLVANSTQFFGFYYVLDLALQALFGALALEHALGRDDHLSLGLRRACIIALSLLFAAAPYTMLRFSGHIALSSQWVLIMGIWLCLKYQQGRLLKWIGIHGAILFAVTGINPYIAMMAAMSPTALTIVDAVRGRLNWLHAVVRMAALGFVMLTGLYLFGFTTGAGASLQSGYGFYSMNLLGPFDSNGHATLMPFDVRDATGGQAWEGYQYQGLGVFVLLLLASTAFQAKPADNSFPFVAALLVVSTSYLLALSNVVTFGGDMIARVPLPGALLQLLEHFRSSGRLFWIGGLWLIVIGVAGVALRFRGMQLITMFVVVLVLQAVDLSGVVTDIRRAVAGLRGTRLDPAQLGRDLTGVRALTILPPWECDREASPGGVEGYEPLSMLSVESRLPINSFYAARTPGDQTFYHCDAQRDILRFGAQTDRIYALTPAVFRAYEAELSSHACGPSAERADIIFCIPKSGATMQLVRNFDSSFGVGAYGTTMLANGWHTPEGWGVWSKGPFSRLVIPISQLEASTFVRISLQFRVFTAPPKRHYQRLRIALQGRTLFSGDFGPERGDGAGHVTLRIDRRILHSSDYVLLDLHHPDATSPERLGVSSDTRNLAIGLLAAKVSAED